MMIEMMRMVMMMMMKVKTRLSEERVSHTDAQTWPFILRLVTKHFLDDDDDDDDDDDNKLISDYYDDDNETVAETQSFIP